MDVHTPIKRSFNMSKIKNKDTKPEIVVRKWLWKNNYRYRLHAQNLPGRPDIVFKSRKSIIFIHGCFWHRHDCKYATIPASRQDFWIKKFQKNVERDRKNMQSLDELGWRVLIIWECEIRKWSCFTELKIKHFLDSPI